MRFPPFERLRWDPTDTRTQSFIGRGWLRRTEDVTVYAGFDANAFSRAQAARPAAKHRDGSLAWMVEAVRALDPPASAGPGTAPRQGALQRATDRRRLLELARGPMASYSLTEIGRWLAASGEEPRFTPPYVRSLAKTAGSLGRPVDRYGEEPHFLFAAHLAFYLLGVPNGTTEAEALDGFVRDPRIAALYLWPDFEPEDLERLRTIYPFIPRWPEGRKTEDCLSLSTRFPETVRGRLYSDLVREIRALAQIPMTDAVLEDLAAIRDERDLMRNARLVECTGIFADLVPRMELMLSADGLDGHDVHIVSKHYSTDPLVAQTVARVFGAKIEVVEGDEELVAHTKAAIEHATEQGRDRAPLVAHIEGIKSFWGWLAEHQRRHPEVRMVGVSHTTSDGRDLLASLEGTSGTAPLPVELMSLSPAKAKDERNRFKHTFGRLLYDVGDALNDTIFNRHFLVLGYGSIIGPAMCDALDAADVRDVVVYDPNPERRAAAREAGFQVIDTLDSEYDRSPFIISCAGTQTLGPEQLDRFTGHPTLLSLGSGRYEFAMDHLEEQARSPGVTRREIGLLGHQPIVEYTLPSGTTFTALADGYVANLAYPRPTIPAYSVTTPLLVWEAIRQGIHHLENGRMGTHMFRTIDIDVSDGGARWLTLYPREVETMSPEAVRKSFIVGTIDQATTHPYIFRMARRAPVAVNGPGPERC